MILQDIYEIFIESCEGAFLQVGVFVGAVLLIFGLINYKREGKLISFLEKKKKLQPIFGSLLGLSPGCGGAIFVMPLYLKGTVTFGTIVATLIATTGDSAFVLMSTLPKKYFIVSAICFFVAIITGYIVDKFHIDKRFIKRKERLLNKLDHDRLSHVQMENCLIKKGLHPKDMQHIGHQEGDDLDMLLHHKGQDEHISPTIYIFTHTYAYKIFWILVLLGLVLGILLLFQVDINTSLKIPHLGTVFGLVGTFFSILYMILNKKVLKNEIHSDEESKIFSLKETLVHNAQDTAFVTTWVFIAYLIYNIGMYAIGGEAALAQLVSTTGLLSVIIGAAIGLIPGCGPQIIFVTLYTKGIIPFAALLANAISQDGDALFPLLAIDKKSSVLATIITTIPALILGILVYYLF